MLILTKKRIVISVISGKYKLIGNNNVNNGSRLLQNQANQGGVEDELRQYIGKTERPKQH